MNLGSDSELLTFNSIEIVRDYVSLDVGLNALLHYELATSLWERGCGIWWFG